MPGRKHATASGSATGAAALDGEAAAPSRVQSGAAPLELILDFGEAMAKLPRETKEWRQGNELLRQNFIPLPPLPCPVREFGT